MRRYLRVGVRIQLISLPPFLLLRAGPCLGWLLSHKVQNPQVTLVQRKTEPCHVRDAVARGVFTPFLDFVLSPNQSRRRISRSTLQADPGWHSVYCP